MCDDRDVEWGVHVCHTFAAGASPGKLINDHMPFRADLELSWAIDIRHNFG